MSKLFVYLETLKVYKPVIQAVLSSIEDIYKAYKLAKSPVEVQDV